MQATDILKEEHRVIEGVLVSLETAADRLSGRQAVPMDFFPKAADFFKDFTDECHHRKEERVLFTGMATNRMSLEAEPLATFMQEHEEGRCLTRAIREHAERIQRGDNTALDPLIQHVREYIMLLSDHINKEDQMLFPMAESMIPVELQEQLTAEFHRIEQESGEDVHEKHLRIAEELAKSVED